MKGIKVKRKGKMRFGASRTTENKDEEEKRKKANWGGWCVLGCEFFHLTQREKLWLLTGPWGVQLFSFPSPYMSIPFSLSDKAAGTYPNCHSSHSYLYICGPCITCTHADSSLLRASHLPHSLVWLLPTYQGGKDTLPRRGSVPKSVFVSS